jgi:hypothetical protein
VLTTPGPSKDNVVTTPNKQTVTAPEIQTSDFNQSAQNNDATTAQSMALASPDSH